MGRALVLGVALLLLSVGCDEWSPSDDDGPPGPPSDDDAADDDDAVGDDDDAVGDDDDAEDDDDAVGDDDDAVGDDDDASDDDTAGDDDTGPVDADGDGTTADIDCDDNDPALNQEDHDGDYWTTCDDDCDDYDASLTPADLDGDGYSTCDGDCDDGEPAAYPGLYEDVGDGIDNDCDGAVDEATICDCPTTASYAEAMDACVNLASESSSAYGAQLMVVEDYGSAIAPQNGCRLLAMHTGTINEDPAQTGNQFNNGVNEWDFTGASVVCGSPTPPGNDTKFDEATVELTLNVPNEVNSFSVDFFFASTEYEEWVCTDYNDTFEMYLESTALDPVDFPDHDGDGIPEGNIAFDGNSLPITVNNNYFVVTQCSTMYALTGFSGQGFTGITGTPCTSMAGTTNDAGATGWLTTTAPVTPGETIVLRFSIWDEGDGIYDSVVFIDNFQWHLAPQGGPDTG